MRINSITDLRREVSAQFEGLMVNCHVCDVEELITIATDKMIDILRDDYDFKYGDEMPDHDIDYFDLIAEFSVSNGY